MIAGFHFPRWLTPLAVMLALWVNVVAMRAQNPADEPLDWRVISVLDFTFREGAKDNVPGLDMPERPFEKGVDLLPPTSSGETRYDVVSWLSQRGVDRSRLSAVLLHHRDKGKIVAVRGPKGTVDLVERLLQDGLLDGSGLPPLKQVEFTVQLWVYESEQAEGWPALADIRAHAAASMRLLDSHSMLMYSGRRVLGKNQAIAAKDTPPSSPDEMLAAAKYGSVLEVEPNVGWSGTDDVQFQLRYEVKLAATGAEPAFATVVSTNGNVVDGNSVVIFRGAAAPAPDGKKFLHRIAVVSVRLLDQRGRTLYEAQAQRDADRKAERARQIDLARYALQGIPVPAK